MNAAPSPDLRDEHLEALEWASERGGYTDESGVAPAITAELVKLRYVERVNFGTAIDSWAYVTTIAGRDKLRAHRKATRGAT